MAIGGVSQSTASSSQLSFQEQQEVNRLKAIDAKVRAHEQAHMAAGAGITGGASYQYTRGPDGRQYAVAGEVSINLSSGSTPEITIERARQVQRAALAPADPSGQDRAVAAAAAMMEMQARAEVSRMKMEGESSGSSPAAIPPSRQAEGLQAYAAEAAMPVLQQVDIFA